MRGICSRPRWDGVEAGRRQGFTPCRRPALSVNDALVSAFSLCFQVIRRPEQVTEEHHDPYLVPAGLPTRAIRYGWHRDHRQV